MSLEVCNLTVSIEDKCIVKDIDFTLDKGSTATILGLSGSGKTTLLRSIAGIHRHDTGKILLEDQPISPAQHVIGYIPQNYGLVPWFTVKRNILEPLKLKGQWSHDKREKYFGLLKSFNIEEVERKYPYALSGGQKQRTAIVRALLLEPQVLLMDEPFSALDAYNKDEAKAIIKKIRNKDLITLMVTHDIKEGIMLGDKIIIISGSPGTIADIIHNDQRGDDTYGASFVNLEKEIYEKIQHGEKNEI